MVQSKVSKNKENAKDAVIEHLQAINKLRASNRLPPLSEKQEQKIINLVSTCKKNLSIREIMDLVFKVSDFLMEEK